MIKLIASDMDGTLINSDHTISQENLEAIKEAESRGIKFAIVTGRAYDDVRPLIDEYNLDCECVALNGGEYYDKAGNVIEGIYIDKNKVREILNVMMTGEFSVEIYTDKGYYTTNTEEETLRGMIKRAKTFHKDLNSDSEYIKFAKANPHFINMNYITDIDEFLKSDVKIAKFVTFGESEKEVIELRKKLEKLSGLAISSSFITNIEVNDSKATKGAILAKVIEKFGLNREQVLVLGDGLNDYSMFKEFPNCIAMENAIPEIKEIAKYVTESNDDAGVGKAINRVLNGEIE
ncbi:Cof-type HAD-IIB family hydrolase [Clostridium butyricum]|uniref:Cof-type HAD-IIB family hydrolase n=1 Tax=Clostridium butyricum TaxID=1492 RepID=UPI0012B9FA32|nr:Cof-type HAD-IIB family hydrolase [Clostridium butyricum]